MDFDQQCYEGNLKVYFPQYFKENYPYVKMVAENLQKESVEQYKKEERSAIARRFRGAHTRINGLLDCMTKDTISTPEKIQQLKMDLVKYTNDKNFKKCKSMGEILKVGFDFVVRNYENVNTYIIR
jgi:predicted transcriptional regulator